MERKRKTLNEYCARYPDRRQKSQSQDEAGLSALPPVTPAVLTQERGGAQTLDNKCKNALFHVDSQHCPFSAEFLSLLECLGFTQPVNIPTHNKGHTLDLVISTGLTVNNLQVQEWGVSYHQAVLVDVELPLAVQKIQRTITFHNLKAINVDTSGAEPRLSMRGLGPPSYGAIEF
ncbi:UNVERIFIED_CONTAM: hypothetical protein FKN15_075117 [Acipenser sinensis]